MKKIQSNFIDTLDFSSIPNIFNIPASKKVINIPNCSSIISVLDFLTSNAEKLPKNIFIIIFNIQEPKNWTFERQKLQTLSDVLKNSESERIFVFQSQLKSIKFLCKIKNQATLTSIEQNRSIYEDDFVIKLSDRIMLFEAVIQTKPGTGICEGFDFSFSNIILDINRHFLGLKLVDYALINFDSISLKFLQLFGIDLSLTNENGERPLETAAKCGNFCGFLELLGVNFEFLTLLHQPTGFNLLMLAAENGNPEIRQFLLELDVFDVNFCVNEKTALKLAMNENKFEAVAVLLEHDAKYGEDLVNNFTEDVKELHELIRAEDEEKIKKILQIYPKTRNFFDSNGQSAIKSAIMEVTGVIEGDCASKSEFIKFLLINGLRMGKTEEFPEILTSMLTENPLCCDYIHKILSNCIIKFDNHHIYVNEKDQRSTEDSEDEETLVNMTSNNSDKNNLKISNLVDIQAQLQPKTEFLSTSLNDIADQSIGDDLGRMSGDIEASTASEAPDAKNRSNESNFELIDNEDTGFLTWRLQQPIIDATPTTTSRKSTTLDTNQQGSVRDGNKILIDALKVLNSIPETKILLEVFSLYENVKVYFNLSNLSLEIKENCSFYAQNLHVQSNYNQSCHVNLNQFRLLLPNFYTQNEFAKILAEKIFNFIATKIDLNQSKDDLLTELKNHQISLSISTQIGKINNLSPIYENISSMSSKFVWKDSKKLEYIAIFKSSQENSDEKLENFSFCPKILITNSSTLTLVQIYQHQTFLIFVDFVKFCDKSYQNEVKELLKHAYLVVSVDPNDKLIESLQNFEVMAKFSDRILFVVDSSHYELQNYVNNENLCPNNLKILEISHIFSDFDKKTKNFLLNKKIDLQGKIVKLSEIIKNSACPVLDDIPLSILIDDSKILKIGQELVDNEKFYYNRRFIDTIWAQMSDAKCLSQTVDPIKTFEELITQKVILLCDEPGMGKTTTLKQLQFKFKEVFPSNWVTYVDLKRHASIYKDFKDVQKWNYKNFTKFFKKIQNLSEFESKIFHQHLLAEKVVFLIDGVDEITQKHKDFMINFTKDLYKITNCLLWIGMRPHCRSEYSGNLHICSYHLESIDASKFLESFIKSQRMSQNEKENARTCVKNLKNYHKSFNNPLFIRIVIDIYDQFEDSVGIYLMYETYVLKKFSFVVMNEIDGQKNSEISENSEISPKFVNSIAKSGNGREIFQKHQKVAIYKFIKSIPKNFVLNNLRILKILPTEDEILNLLNFKVINAVNTVDEIYFIHKTFYEFFVASFLIEMIFERSVEVLKDELCDLLFANVFIDVNNHVIGKFIESYIEDNLEIILEKENSNLKEILRKNKLFVEKSQGNLFEENLVNFITSKFFCFAKFVMKIFENEIEINEIFTKTAKKLPTIFEKIVKFSHSSSEILEILNFLATNFEEPQRIKIFEYFLYFQEENLRIFATIFKRLNESDLQDFFKLFSHVFTQTEISSHINFQDDLNIINLIIKNIKRFEISAKKLEIVFKFSKNFLESEKKILFFDKIFESFEFLTENEKNFSDIESLIKEIFSSMTINEIGETLNLENGKITQKILKFVSSKIRTNFYEYLIWKLDANLNKKRICCYIESEPNLKIEFHKACCNFDGEKVKIFWKFAILNLEKIKLREFLTYKPENAQFSTFNFAITNFCVINFEEFFSILEIKKFLLTKNSENETILFEINRKNKLNHFAVEFIFKVFKTMELKNYLNHRNNDGNSAFNYDGRQTHLDFLTHFDFQTQSQLLIFVHDYFHQNELFEMIKLNRRSCQIL